MLFLSLAFSKTYVHVRTFVYVCVHILWRIDHPLALPSVGPIDIHGEIQKSTGMFLTLRDCKSSKMLTKLD